MLPLGGSLELRDPDPVKPLGDRDLGVFTIANIAPENPGAALPAHSIAGTPTRADPSGNRRRTPALALARLARRAPGQSLSTRHISYPRATKIPAMFCSENTSPQKIAQPPMHRPRLSNPRSSSARGELHRYDQVISMEHRNAEMRMPAFLNAYWYRR
jgi:hypothetical protein